MLDDIKKLFLECRSFANFLSSSIVVIKLQSRCFQGRKSISLSFNLENIFGRIMRASERNSLSKAWERCGLGDDISGIFRYVRMPISSGSIFPDFADIYIRGELLALSMSMDMFFRLVPLSHLNKSHRNQMLLMQCIAKYICRIFIKKQMLKCK
jgi:hypothetical protein